MESPVANEALRRSYPRRRPGNRRSVGRVRTDSDDRSVARVGADETDQLVATGEPLDVLSHTFGESSVAHRPPARCCVARNDRVLEIPERMTVRERLRICYIERRTADSPGDKRLD